MIEMNIYINYYFHILQHSKWQSITHLTSWCMVLHPLTLTKYTSISLHGEPWDPNLIWVLTSCLHELEKL
jgi:hypothetical protein